MKKLEGRVALVTGAARGIGAAIARRLAADGADVVVNYSKSEKQAHAVADDIRRAGRRAKVIKADIGDVRAAQALVEETTKELGRLDILVNNAVSIAFSPVEAIDLAQMRSQFATNVEGPIAAMRAAAGRFPKEGGRVINISSLITTHPLPGTTVYAATKGALDAMTRVWAKELGPKNVTVNSVAPGPVETDALRENSTEEMNQVFIGRTPLGRLGTSEDIADVVAFLASPEARWITGHVLVATGGFTP